MLDGKPNPQALAGLGIALAEQGRTEEAVIHLKKALEQEPRIPTAHEQLGSILAEEGKLQEAEASYRKAVALRPNAETHAKLADVLTSLGREGEAREERELAAALARRQGRRPEGP